VKKILPLSTLAATLAVTFTLAPAEEKDNITALGSGRADSRITQQTESEAQGEANRSSNEARIDPGSGERLLGNLGMNVAAGSGNAQANSGALLRSSQGDVFATAHANVSQSTRTSRNGSTQDSPNEASLDAALAGASGNLGINVIAGSGNAQANQFALVEVDQAGNASALSTVEQKSGGARSQMPSGPGLRDSAQSATISTGALLHVNGNLGVSVGAGSGNAQANSLSVIQTAR
jgi:hypothetical protein